MPKKISYPFLTAECNTVMNKLEGYKEHINYERIKDFFEKEKENINARSIGKRGQFIIDETYRMNPGQFKRFVDDWKDEIPEGKSDKEIEKISKEVDKIIE